MAILTLKGCYIDVNEAMVAHCGYAREEMIGHTTAELAIFADKTERENYYSLLQQENRIQSFPARLRVHSGEVRHCVLFAQKITLDEQDCVLTIRIDVTDCFLAGCLRLRQFPRMPPFVGFNKSHLPNLL